MKKMLVFLVLMNSLSSFANSDCVDARATTFPPCGGGEKIFYVQGKCPKSYQVESTYCAEEGRPECLDARATTFSPCKKNLTRVFVQGQCEKITQFEHSYCAIR